MMIDLDIVLHLIDSAIGECDMGACETDPKFYENVAGLHARYKGGIEALVKVKERIITESGRGLHAG